LTPEAAGVSAADHRGLGRAPIEGWVRRSAPGGMLMIGGRVLDPSRRPKLAVTFDDGSPDQRSLVSEILQPGAFLRFAPIPAATAVADAREYAKVSVSATEGDAVAIEQFDASPARILFGFGDGWHEQELNPRTGARWRWLSERGEIRLGSRPADPLRLHIEGESPLTYFSRGSRLKIRSGDQVLRQVLSSDFGDGAAAVRGRSHRARDGSGLRPCRASVAGAASGRPAASGPAHLRSTSVPVSS
jgi:hypothetical protein